MAVPLPMTDYSPFYFYLPQETYRRVEKGQDPLAPSLRESRAVGAGTGGIYITFDVETAVAETEKLINPVLYKIQCLKEIQVLNLPQYCSKNGIQPGDCYAGEQNLNKKIHHFYGQGVPGMSWPSNQRPTGMSAVLLVDNIPDFRNCFHVSVCG